MQKEQEFWEAVAHVNELPHVNVEIFAEDIKFISARAYRSAEGTGNINEQGLGIAVS